MTVSNSTNFSQNRNQIINLAMSAIGIKTNNRALTAPEINEASDILNVMVKSWKNRGNYLWKYAEGTLFLTSRQAKYKLDGSTAHATESYNETTTTSAAVSGATTIVVSSTSGFVVGYNIGVVQDDNTILWTTITIIAGSTITLNTALTADAASGNAVYVYQNKINRPESITSLRARTSSGTDTPTTALSRDSYFNIPVKTNSARPNQWYYDKQLTYGDLYLWPTPNAVSDIIKFTFQKMFFDFDSGVDDPDFPVEWIRAMYLNLALDLARIKGKDKEFREQLKRDADEALADCQGYDREPASIYFQPATSVNMGSYR